jgi:hypothetical protein
MPDHQVSLCSQGVENSGKLDGNVTRSYNGNTLRLFFDLEETVGVDTVRGTRDVIVRRNSGSTTDSNDDLLCLDSVRGLVITSDLDLVLGDERSPSLVVIDLVID